MKRIVAISLVCIFLSIVTGQTQPDKNLISTLPIWITEDSISAAASDTLFQRSVQPSPFKLRSVRWIGAGTVIISGMLSYYFHQQAEDSYHEYLRTGDIDKMDPLFSKAKRMDRYTGLAYIGVEIGLILFSISFYQ